MFIADLHIHSKYSRATSKDMDLENISKWAAIKGVDLLGTGDFTHPGWLKEIKNKLEEEEYGIYKFSKVFFMLTAEVNSIYFKKGKVQKVHNIIVAPTFKIVDEINDRLKMYGNLAIDGRPILGLDCEEMAKILYGISSDIIIIPAHAWTPHFSVFGSNSGFDSLEECFGKEAGRISAIETGLSSDPGMNWRIPGLDRITMTSNSDAHSPQKIGREATVFNKKIGYKEFIETLKKKDKDRLLYTIEFYPEEGKYHWDGHRRCGICISPEETVKLNYKCPKCSKKITVGVMHRIEKLASRPENFTMENAPAYKHVIPLKEIIASARNVGVNTLTVEKEYNKLIQAVGAELEILVNAPKKILEEACPEDIYSGIMNMRAGNVEIKPGYDGEYGKVNVKKGLKKEKQLALF